jgi:superfamily II DNA or RNA helicase
MERDQRQQLRAITGEVARWVGEANALLSYRAKISAAGDKAAKRIRRAVVDVRVDSQVAWRIMPLRADDNRDLSDIARQHHLPLVTVDEDKTLGGLATQAAAALRDVKAITGGRRFFQGSKKREAGADAADYIRSYREWALASGVPQMLQRLSPEADGTIPDVPLSDALADWVGLSRRIADLGAPGELFTAAVVGELPGSVRAIEHALREEAQLRSHAQAAGVAVRRSEVRRMLAEMPVERLKEVTRDRLRIGPLTSSGLRTIQAVLDRGYELEYLPGIGAVSASQIQGAAETLRQTTYDEMPVRIDIKNRTPETTELLRCLGAWDVTRKLRNATAELALAEALVPLARALDNQVTHIGVLSVTRPVGEFRAAVQALSLRARQIGARPAGGRPDDPWDDFLQRPADYFAMLSELGFNTEDEQKTHGDLPDDIVEAVRRLELDTQHLSASLRGYQSFGARFALVQRKVIIGDEMGLGKTVEALAVLAHLRSKGAHHALVICPAAVVTNWVREVLSKSALRPHRLHGPGREIAARNWVSNGGVAVTTFETLRWLEDQRLAMRDLGCVVVDEAHYIKNPTAKRTERAARILNGSDRVILLTGTPLENRIDEFRNLVSYIRPDLVVDIDELAPRRFRRQVAPAYLRRNQEDVLTELPELVEVDEWLPMSAPDVNAYRDAVTAGNFMAMRQAAMSQGGKSEKMRRLTEIVTEAEDNGRRVIVFSHFRNVLDHVAREVPGRVFGPLTGSMPAPARQVLVDQFSAASHGAVLVSQIVAGGVGLNIQAASVVVICEPQLKPTTEWQAIARAHRMGQLESVQVHRLLSEEGVDQRITDILARKRDLFDDFARISETAGSAPEALDISEADLAREVVAAERARLFSNSDDAVRPQDEEAV